MVVITACLGDTMAIITVGMGDTMAIITAGLEEIAMFTTDQEVNHPVLWFVLLIVAELDLHIDVVLSL